MVGRRGQIKEIEYIKRKKKSSFVAVTGRRRVGKTFLIDEVFKKDICFRVTGIQNGELSEQLLNFSNKIAEYSNNGIVMPARDWQEVFMRLKNYLETLDKRSKKVIFIDELPWMSSVKSNFLQMLAHLWNDYLSKEKHFILVICGSATSWITKKIINDVGGLHNRITETINLQPFTLGETKLFLKSIGVNMNNQAISKVYMAMGGIPFYLENIKKGESATVAIERMCFTKGGILTHEYENLYKALFRNSDNHEKIVGALATHKYGLTRQELISKTKIKSGGPINRVIEDLVVSGFVVSFSPFGRKKRGEIYHLNDEYSVFYHRFIKSNRKNVKGVWQQISASQSYKVWTGFAFELLCKKHLDMVKSSLGISGIYTEFSDLRVVGNENEKGFQIDLIIDRKDETINLCEIKYYNGSFKIDKDYALQLLNRKQQFIEQTKTKKQVIITMITNFELFENSHSSEVVESEIILDEMFSI